ncbi:hypothetical protein M422DRAFT_154308 [Sphaerobolus stellatus SS14]|nr:hypothetical protein M422DRAFT_154308 [Sphaerobolus stellatus SS14]
MPTIQDSRCILIIGATAGIGRELARAIHDLPTKPTVIVSGRRKERLDELVEEGKKKGGRMEAIQVDLNAGNDKLRAFADEAVSKYPELDTIIFSAGIQHIVDFKNPSEEVLNKFTDEFTTNYVSSVRLIHHFLPHLMSIGRPAFLIPITSNLSMIPLPETPTYSATKAALHSLSMSLRFQLKETNVHIIEIIPPLVESELHDHQGNVPILSKFWFPLDEFTKLTVEGLLRGDEHIVYPGASKDNFKEFEERKIEKIEKILAQPKARR